MTPTSKGVRVQAVNHGGDSWTWVWTAAGEEVATSEPTAWMTEMKALNEGIAALHAVAQALLVGATFGSTSLSGHLDLTGEEPQVPE